MAQNCIFCEEELSLFNRKTLYACGTEQPVCKNCHARFIPLPRVEIGRRALATGRAQDAETLRAYLNDHDRRMQKKAAADESAQKARISDKLCSRCSVPMVIVGQQQFQLGEHTLFWGDLAHLAAGSLTLDMLCCPKCRKVEFFLPESADI